MNKLKMLTFIVLITNSTASLASKTDALINVQTTAATSSAAGTATTGAAAGSLAGSLLATGTLSTMAVSFGIAALATLVVYSDESNKGSDSSTSTSVTTKG